MVNAQTDIHLPITDLNALWYKLTLPIQIVKNGNGSNGSGPNGNHSLMTSVQELRPADDWQADVAYIASAIRHGELEKAVLARSVRLRASKNLDVSAALRKLVKDYVG